MLVVALSPLVVEVMFVSRNSVARIEETSDALQSMQTFLWSGLARERVLFAQQRELLAQRHSPSLVDGKLQAQLARRERLISVEIPRQMGYALIVLDCSRCEAFLEEAVRQCLADSFVHREVGGKKVACGINNDQCRSVLSPKEVTCHRCKRVLKADGSSASGIKGKGFSRLKEEVRLINLYVEEQEPLWNAMEDLYAIRCFIVHQGGSLRTENIGAQNQILERLKTQYQEFGLVRKDKDGSYIFVTPELCDQFRRAVGKLLANVWGTSLDGEAGGVLWGAGANPML